MSKQCERCGAVLSPGYNEIGVCEECLETNEQESHGSWLFDMQYQWIPEDNPEEENY